MIYPFAVVGGRVTRGLVLAVAAQVLTSVLFVASVGGTSQPIRPLIQPVAPVAVPAAAPAAPPAPAPVPAPALEVAAPPAPVPPPVPAGPRRVMLIGDSMAFTAGIGLAPHAPAHGFDVINEGINGCGVVRGGPYRYFGATRDMEPRCEAWTSAWQGAVDRHRPDMVALFIGRWELMDRVHNGAWTNVFDPAFVAYVESEVDQAITIAGSTGARVVLFSQPYYLRGLNPAGGIWPEDDPARVDAVNALLRRVAERRGVPIVDVGGWLSPEGKYTPHVNGMKVRSDGVHLTRQTGGMLAPWLFPQLAAL